MPSVESVSNNEFKRVMLNQNKAYLNLVLFLIIYFLILFAKLVFGYANITSNPYLELAIISLTELIIWVAISLKYYPSNLIRAGIILFYSVLSWYALVPVVLLSFDLDLFPFDSGSIRNGIVAQSISVTNIYFFIHLLIKPSLTEFVNRIIEDWFRKLNVTVTGGYLVGFFGLFVALVYYFNFVNSGVSELIGQESRVVIAATAETGKTWVLQYIFFAWLMSISAVRLFKVNYRFSGVAFFLIISSVSLFLFAYLSIGNRRELAVFLLFLLLLSVRMRNSNLSVAVIFTLPALLVVGLMRVLQGASIDDFDLNTNVMNLFGEFIFPHYSLIYYSSFQGFEHELGRSFFILPGYAIPSFGLWDKLNSLSFQFASDYAGLDMGYALTPLAEGYINFGWAAIFITPLLLTFTLVFMFRTVRIAPFGILVIMSFPLDISRGEFTTIAFQWLIFSTVFLAVCRLHGLHSVRTLR